MHAENNQESQIEYPLKVLFPSVFRWFIEFTSWFWLILATVLTFNILYLLAFSLSILLYWRFSASKDNSKDTVYKVPGITIVFIELFSIFMGVIGASAVIGEFGSIQGILAFLAYSLDIKRWLWLIGIYSNPPESVAILFKLK